MTKHISLAAQTREIKGSKVKTLRSQGLLPANVFGNKIDSQAITLDTQIFTKAYQEVGSTGLIKLEVEGVKSPFNVLVSEVQYDPITGDLLHVDLHNVDLTEKVTAMVPINFLGEAPAVKSHGARILTTLEEIEVEALPTDIPESFDVDLSTLIEVGDTITVETLSKSDAVTILTDVETTLVVAQEPKTVEDPDEDASDEVTEAETTVQDKNKEESEE